MPTGTIAEQRITKEDRIDNDNPSSRRRCCVVCFDETAPLVNCGNRACTTAVCCACQYKAAFAEEFCRNDRWICCQTPFEVQHDDFVASLPDGVTLATIFDSIDRNRRCNNSNNNIDNNNNVGGYGYGYGEDLPYTLVVDNDRGGRNDADAAPVIEFHGGVVVDVSGGENLSLIEVRPPLSSSVEVLRVSVGGGAERWYDRFLWKHIRRRKRREQRRSNGTTRAVAELEDYPNE